MAEEYQEEYKKIIKTVGDNDPIQLLTYCLQNNDIDSLFVVKPC
jgi:hypothetical protein